MRFMSLAFIIMGTITHNGNVVEYAEGARLAPNPANKLARGAWEEGINLGDDEAQVAEFYFNKHQVGSVSTLTSKRLVVTYKNAEESFPLSKIIGVRWTHKRSMGMVVLRVIVVLGGLASLSGHAIGSFIAMIIGALIIGAGWSGQTILSITQMGGEKRYAVKGRSLDLMSFVDAVNRTLA